MSASDFYGSARQFDCSSESSPQNTLSSCSGDRLSLEVTVECDDRWQAYHRLKSLGITCQCASFQPLKVCLQTPTEAIQLWSVIRHISKCRQVLVEALEESWQTN